MSNTQNTQNLAIHRETSSEERDQIDRSTKKSKRKITHLIFNQEPPNETTDPQRNPPKSTQPPPNGNPPPSKGVSFRDMVAMDQSLLRTNNFEDEDDLSDDDEQPENHVEDPKCPMILLSKEEKQRIRRPWKHALIIKMFDSKIGYMSLMKRLKKKWELNGGLVLTDIGHDYFIARFSNIGDYNHVLTQGPWMLDDNYLTIRKWIPNFIPDNSPMRHLTAWVRIPHLSVEYFDKEFLHKIGSKIGKVTRIDNNTALAQRGQFTRLSVELDLSKPLLSKFWLRGKIWQVQYEGLRMICFQCGKIGHQGENCSSHIEPSTVYNQKNRDEEDKQKDVIIQTVEEKDFGEWMMVKKPPPRRRIARPEKQQGETAKENPGKAANQEQSQGNQREKSGGSRFTILRAQNTDNITHNILNVQNQDNTVHNELHTISTNMETIDLGKSSQITNIGSQGNPFNIGKSNKNSSNYGQLWEVLRSGKKYGKRI
ncbi:uncharacterized protein [Spinacia oleracea]|uniref:CCHC-type domain-containing protein n=1 Tax=Spinacia oleracea TaxID=3562 RepID=A0ABM3QR88_SPIOL|nr:uncharacterized protein LOC130461733 [Spinacia oleracea]